MHLKSSEVTLIYCGDREKDRKTLAYALTITPHVNKQDLRVVDISTTLFEYAINALCVEPKQILNKADPYYQEMAKGREFHPDSWWDAIKKRPELLRAPIAIYKGRAVICETPTDIFKVTRFVKTPISDVA